eukprot:6115509-Pyramimonas_sp.AAC.1
MGGAAFPNSVVPSSCRTSRATTSWRCPVAWTRARSPWTCRAGAGTTSRASSRCSARWSRRTGGSKSRRTSPASSSPTATRPRGRSKAPLRTPRVARVNRRGLHLGAAAPLGALRQE